MRVLRQAACQAKPPDDIDTLGLVEVAEILGDSARGLIPWDQGNPSVGLPVFSHQAHNGVSVDWLGTEGSVVAQGHVEPHPFAVACNSLARRDGRPRVVPDYPAFAREVRHEYAVHGFGSTPENWRIHWDGVTAGTSGSFPVTIYGTGW